MRNVKISNRESLYAPKSVVSGFDDNGNKVLMAPIEKLEGISQGKATKLKDKDGNYLWQEDMDTILGKPVYISEFMPSIATGKKVIAFGDFSYYWILNRRPLAVRALKEKFELYDQTGYLAMEYIDGKLVNREAIKVMQIS